MKLKLQYFTIGIVAVLMVVFASLVSGEVPRRSACYEPKAIGICRGRLLRYAYDMLSGTCVSFFYSGCAATANNFLTYEECRRECMPKMIY